MSFLGLLVTNLFGWHRNTLAEIFSTVFQSFLRVGVACRGALRPPKTMGTDIENYLKLDESEVEMNLEDIKFDKEKKKGQIRWKDPKLLAKHVESLEASPPTRPIYVILCEDNNMFVPYAASHPRGLVHRLPYLPSHMRNTGVCPDNTALRLLTPSARGDNKVVWLHISGIVHVQLILRRLKTTSNAPKIPNTLLPRSQRLRFTAHNQLDKPTCIYH